MRKKLACYGPINIEIIKFEVRDIVRAAKIEWSFIANALRVRRSLAPACQPLSEKAVRRYGVRLFEELLLVKCLTVDGDFQCLSSAGFQHQDLRATRNYAAPICRKLPAQPVRSKAFNASCQFRKRIGGKLRETSHVFVPV